MKKVFSSLLLIFILPLRQFKKIFKDNFLSGLIFGAIFSLIVNVLSMQIQGLVDKQRILEAIENEISNNMLQANYDMTMAKEKRKIKEKANPYILIRKFSRDLWEQSTEPLQYVAQLDSKTQMLISGYYSIWIPYSNSTVEILNEIYSKSMTNCFDYSKVLTKIQDDDCDLKYYIYLSNGAQYISNDISRKSYELLKIFHPTQNRLNSPILRFLMGSESMRILSGK